VLNLRADWHDSYPAIRRARDELGIDVQTVGDWDELVAFARSFAKKRYSAGGGGG
jgi:hypothetical protein